MAWYPIALVVPQYENGSGLPYSGAVLKAYAAGTTTPISMATDTTGATTAGSIALNASGNPVVSGNVVIPHLAQSYKLALYPTQAAADANSGALWTVDNMDTLGAMITSIVGAQAFTTGDVKLTMKTVADTGWVMCNDGTIGNPSSSATTRANEDTEALFTLLWNNVSNTYAPVSSGRGASAAADFAANKTIGLTRTMGRLIGIAGSGSGLSARALGLYLGEETHVLTEAEMPAHTHALTDPGHTHSAPTASGAVIDASAGSNGRYAYPPGTTGSSTTGITISNTGSGTAHNNMPPTAFLNAMIKL